MTLLLGNVASAGIEMSVTLSASPPNVAQGGTTTIRASITATYDGILGQQLDTGEASIVDSLAWTFGTATCLSSPADGAAETFQFNETGTFDITVSATRTVTYADETTGSATASATLQVTISATNPPHVDRVVITDDRTWSPLALEKGSGSVTLTAHACWNGPDGQPNTADDWGMPASFTWSQSPSDLGTLSSSSGSTVRFTAGSVLQNGSVTATVTGGSGTAASVPIYLYEGPRCADIDLDDENWYFGGTITLGWVKANPSDDITGVTLRVIKPDNTVLDHLVFVDAAGGQSKDIKVVLDQCGLWTFQCSLWGFHWAGSRSSGFDSWSPSVPHHSPPGADGEDKQKREDAIQVDLDLAGLAEDKEETPGGFLMENDNWDEHNVVNDWYVRDKKPHKQDGIEVHRIVGTDQDLKSLTISISGTGTGAWRLDYPAQDLMVWREQPNGAYALVESGRDSTAVTLPISLSLKVEGIDYTGMAEDYVICASFRKRGTTVASGTDRVRLRVTRIEFVPPWQVQNPGFTFSWNDDGIHQFTTAGHVPSNPLLVVQAGCENTAEASARNVWPGISKVSVHKATGAGFTVVENAPEPGFFVIKGGENEELSYVRPKISGADVTWGQPMHVQVWQMLRASIATYTVNGWTTPTRDDVLGVANGIWKKQAVCEFVSTKGGSCTVDFPEGDTITVEGDGMTDAEKAIWKAIPSKDMNDPDHPVTGVVVFLDKKLNVVGQGTCGGVFLDRDAAIGRNVPLALVTRKDGKVESVGKTAAHELAHYLDLVPYSLTSPSRDAHTSDAADFTSYLLSRWSEGTYMPWVYARLAREYGLKNGRLLIAR